jgi:hypothetical protein
MENTVTGPNNNKGIECREQITSKEKTQNTYSYSEQRSALNKEPNAFGWFRT